VSAFNPFEHYGPSLQNSATKSVAIVPSDVSELTRAIKGLRIWNPTASPADVTVTTSGGSTVTFTVPANSVIIESLVIVQVWATGSTVGLILHGYTD
jgi:hypothetical protein